MTAKIGLNYSFFFYFITPNLKDNEGKTNL